MISVHDLHTWMHRAYYFPRLSRLAAEAFWLRHLRVQPHEARKVKTLQCLRVINPVCLLSNEVYDLPAAVAASEIHEVVKRRWTIYYSHFQFPTGRFLCACLKAKWRPKTCANFGAGVAQQVARGSFESVPRLLRPSNNLNLCFATPSSLQNRFG